MREATVPEKTQQQQPDVPDTREEADAGAPGGHF